MLFRGSFAGRCPSKPSVRPRNVLEGSGSWRQGLGVLGTVSAARAPLPPRGTRIPGQWIWNIQLKHGAQQAWKWVLFAKWNFPVPSRQAREAGTLLISFSQLTSLARPRFSSCSRLEPHTQLPQPKKESCDSLEIFIAIFWP